MSTLKVANIESQSGGGVSAKISDVGGGQLSNRNLIINGDMRIAQRGTSESGLTDSPKFVVDRFAYRRAGSWGTNSFTMSQQSSGAPDGFKHFLRLAQSGTAAAPPANTWCGFGHYIEGNNAVQVGLGTSAAQQLTLSFYAKASQAGTYCVQVGNAVDETFIAEYSVTTSWQRFTISIPARTSGTWNTDTNTGIYIHWIISADSDGTPSGSAGWSDTNARYTTNQTEEFASNAGATFDLCGVQLEVGNTATTFEHRSFGDELAKCQRYFFKTFNYSVAPAQNTSDTSGAISFVSTNAGLHEIICDYPVAMRATPSTITRYAPDAATSNWYTNSDTPTSSLNMSGERGCTIRANGITATGRYFSIHISSEAEL